MCSTMLLGLVRHALARRRQADRDKDAGNRLFPAQRTGEQGHGLRRHQAAETIAQEIVSTSSVSEMGSGFFAYYLALYGSKLAKHISL